MIEATLSPNHHTTTIITLPPKALVSTWLFVLQQHNVSENTKKKIEDCLLVYFGSLEVAEIYIE